MNIPFFLLSVVLLAVPLISRPAMAADPCKIDKAAAVDVVVTPPNEMGNATNKTAKDKAQLKDTVTFNVTGFDPPECVRKLVLFVNGLPVADARPVREKPLTFILGRTEKSGELWRLLLGRPSIGDTRRITVGFGLPDGPPLHSASIEVEALPSLWFCLWFAVFAFLVIVFLLCAIKTSILRDGVLDPRAAPGSKATYSLGRTQAAWWLFVILACYMLIGAATGDFLSSINGTAVLLLGIGAGTALGGAAVDASKDTPTNRQEQQLAAVAAKNRMTDLEQDIQANQKKLCAQGAAAMSVAKQGEAKLEMAQQEKEKADTQAQYDKLMGVSQNFITDILSDANGISFHRFQMVAWTLVLSVVFAADVYENLAMPTFSPVLLGLLGLSAGTYIGLKIPEPVVPKR